MIDTKLKPKQKKSQKRVDRQARRAEKRKQKELLEQHKLNNQEKKPIRVRLSKKSLPGFLAKNVDAILKWLKEYETLFNLADDYGIQRLDRLPEEKRNLLVQNYVDISDFITMVEQIKNEEELKALDKQKNIVQDDEQYLKKDELDQLVDLSNDNNVVDYKDEPKWEAIEFDVQNQDTTKISISPDDYFKDVKEYVESFKEIE